MKRGQRAVVHVWASLVRRLCVPAMALPLAGAPEHGPVGVWHAAGLKYTMTTTVRGTTTGGHAVDYALVARVQVAGEQARMDFAVAPNGARPDPAMPTFMAPGTYWLVSRGARVVTVVDPGRREYYDLDVSALVEGGAGATLNQSISDVVITAQAVPGDSLVDGRHTRHFRVTDHHTVKVSVFGMSTTSHVARTTDYYFAAALKSAIDPFMESMRQSAATMRPPSEYLEKLSAAWLGMAPRGAPLLEIQQTAITDARNHHGVSSQTRRVTDVIAADVPESVFMIPADYEKTQSVLAAGGAAVGVSNGETGGPADGAAEAGRAPAAPSGGQVRSGAGRARLP